MRFGIDIVSDVHLDVAGQWWQAAERGGLEVIGVPDSPMVCREPFVSAAHCLSITSSAIAMIAVSNPISRDVSVTAASLATLAEIGPGRIAYGIGSGDSALWGVGLRSAKVETLRQYVLALKKLLGGKAASYRGRRMASTWATADVPVYVACSGTRTLRMASEVADGLILAMGYSDENLAHVRNTIADAAAATDRDPADLDVWWHCSLGFAPSVEEGLAANLGVNPGWLTMTTMDGKQIPEEVRPALAELTSDFRRVDTEYTTQHRGAHLVQRAIDLGIYDWLAGRAPGLWGPPAHIVDRLAAFDRAGMSNWLFYGGGADIDRAAWIDVFSTEVIPALATR